MNPIRALHDWSRKKKVAQELLTTLTRRGRPGGIDVSRADPEFAAALMYLLEKRPDLTVVKNKTRATLMFKADVDTNFGPDTTRAMARGGVLTHRGEDIYVGSDEAGK